MKHVAVFVAFLAVCASVHAHLNHVQFAAVEESGGKLRVRYRMSADMFLSNLDAEIKSGRVSESIRNRPIDEIIREYFKTHLLLETGGAAHEAESAAFTFDAKTSDWIADFAFAAPAAGAEAALVCDAFLENNPRTQTLARIDWRGEKTMHHFRKDNARYVLGSSLSATTPEDKTAAKIGSTDFADGLARALRAYDFLAAGALVFFVLGHMAKKWPRVIVPTFAIAAAVALAMDQCARESLPHKIGYAAGWFAIALTSWALTNRDRKGAALCAEPV